MLSPLLFSNVGLIIFPTRKYFKLNKKQPKTSPTPTNIPESPTNCLAISPNCPVKPRLGPYTPLKKESSIPAKDKSNLLVPQLTILSIKVYFVAQYSCRYQSKNLKFLSVPWVYFWIFFQGLEDNYL